LQYPYTAHTLSQRTGNPIASVVEVDAAIKVGSAGFDCIAVTLFCSSTIGIDGIKDKTSDLIRSELEGGSEEEADGSSTPVCTAVIKFASFGLGSDGINDKTSDLM
jgi:hypothetical protein